MVPEFLSPVEIRPQNPHAQQCITPGVVNHNFRVELGFRGCKHDFRPANFSELRPLLFLSKDAYEEVVVQRCHGVMAKVPGCERKRDTVF